MKAKVILSEENFPDANFRKAIAKILGICEGDEITDVMIRQTTKLSVPYKAIANLKGIEHFTALEYLYCYNNQLTSLDVSKNTTLKVLYCNYNQLTALDVSKNTALKVLNCRNNQLTSLDVSQNTALTDLSCNGNQLEELDITENTSLTFLSCRKNKIKEIDTTQNHRLFSLITSNDIEVFSSPNYNKGLRLHRID